MRTRTVRELWWTWRKWRTVASTNEERMQFALGVAITVGLLAFVYVVFKFFALIQSMTL